MIFKIVGGAVTFGLIAIALRRRFGKMYYHQLMIKSSHLMNVKHMRPTIKTSAAAYAFVATVTR